MAAPPGQLIALYAFNAITYVIYIEPSTTTVSDPGREGR